MIFHDFLNGLIVLFGELFYLVDFCVYEEAVPEGIEGVVDEAFFAV
jgi:hypothetical protein